MQASRVKTLSLRLLRILLCASLVWGLDETSFAFHASRSTAGMLLLLAVLAIATLGDWWLAMSSAAIACLSFNYNYIDDAGSLAIRTLDGAITFSAMVITALTGS